MILKLEDEIEVVRQQMIVAANSEGLSGDLTIQLSRELDELINYYNAQKRAGNLRAKAGN
jgi:F0F1-type ATP synthase gamma subunit